MAAKAMMPMTAPTTRRALRRRPRGAAFVFLSADGASSTSTPPTYSTAGLSSIRVFASDGVDSVAPSLRAFRRGRVPALTVLPSTAARAAAPNSPVVAKRSSGFFASARSMTASTCFGSSGTTSRADGIGSFMCAHMRAASVSRA